MALTAEQTRLMKYLRERQGGRWVSLVELAETKLLEPDDDLFVPSLVALGLVEHRVQSAAIRATPGKIA